MLLLHAINTSGAQPHRFSSGPEMYFGFAFSRPLVTDEGCTTPAARLLLNQRGLRRVLKRFDPQTRSPPSRWVFCCTFRAEIHPQSPVCGGSLTETEQLPFSFNQEPKVTSLASFVGAKRVQLGAKLIRKIHPGPLRDCWSGNRVPSDPVAFCGRLKRPGQ